MAKFISDKIKKKSAARLGAVQATYMIEYGQLPVDEVIKDFVNGEVGRYVIEEDSDGYEVYENMVEVEAMDTNYFAFYNRYMCFTILFYNYNNISKYKSIYYITSLYFTRNI
mgnify:CR=1 FL=1